MQFRVLGDLEVRRDGEAIPLGTHQQRAVLAILVLHAGEVVSGDRLIDELWGDEPPARAAKTVQVYVSRLRKALGTPDGHPGDPIVTRGHGYVLQVEPERVDFREFEGLLDEGRGVYAGHDFETAAAVLDRALELWRGPPLADFTFDPFAASEIARLDELRLEALEIRIDAGLALGRHGALVAELEVLTAENPQRERLQAQRMLALYRCGRQADALAVYREARRALVDELGIEPSRALRDLHEAILRQDPALEPATLPRAPPPASGPLGAGRRRQAVAAVVLCLAAAGAAVIALIAHNSGDPAAAHVPANSVAVIDPARNAVVRQVAVGARPGDISAGAGGVWVDNLDDKSVSEIDPKSATVTRTLSIEGARVDAMAASAAAVWTIDFPRAVATQLDPTYGTAVRSVQLGVPSGYAGEPVPSPVATSGGSVWAATGNATVARIDARSHRVTASVDVGNEPTGIAVGSGATWVTDDLDNTVSRIDSAGVVTSTLPVGNGASGIAVGAGAVWVANTLDDTVTRIDAATGAPKAVIPVGAGPRGVAIGAGSVWVADSRAAAVSRIDPRTNNVVQTIAIGESPEDLVVDGGRVWVTVQAGPPPPGPPVAGGTLRVMQEKDFGPTDPATLISDGPQAAQLEFATCAKLLNYPDRAAPEGRRLLPEVARALPTVSRDGRTYKFTVRPGFRFSPPSNQPVTARSFQRAIERFLKLGDTWTELGDIAGAAAYRAGRTRYVAGVTATADALSIRLAHPSPSLPARTAMPALCAVPADTPIHGLTQVIPSAGPYYIASHTAGSQLVLRRNPNYHGPRRSTYGAISYEFGVTPARSSALVEAGAADYANAAYGFGYFDPVPAAIRARLERDYGPHSPAARAGRQRSFVNRTPQQRYLVLNARRPLFASPRMRQAVNFAVDRPTLVRDLGPTISGLPTDQYLPTSMPGFSDADIYPLGGPDLARARRLAHGHGGRAVMYTCETAECLHVAETVQLNLRAIGITVVIKEIPEARLFPREYKGGEPYDLAYFGWVSDFGDPSDFIDSAFTGLPVSLRGANFHGYRARVAAAAKLAGEERLRAYGQIDIDLATNAAPAIAYADITAHDFFSTRVGCQTYQPLYGMDLATLCRRGER